MNEYERGCCLPIDEWIWLNRFGIFENPSLRKYVAPFPPASLMHNVSGLNSEPDFASHGAAIYQAITQAAEKPLADFGSVLDFGCGCGRFARMLKGHPYTVHGCDIDPRHVAWARENLSYMEVAHTSVHPPLPYAADSFDAVVSISVFTHLNESSQFEFLAELHRITRPGGRLFLTIHGDRALQRAENEPAIRNMISVPDDLFQEARHAYSDGKHAFILQNGHLTNRSRTSILRELLFGRKLVKEPFEYGITFIPESYLREYWDRWFEVLAYLPGAIHSFQDIAVLTPNKVRRG